MTERELFIRRKQIVAPKKKFFDKSDIMPGLATMVAWIMAIADREIS